VRKPRLRASLRGSVDQALATVAAVLLPLGLLVILLGWYGAAHTPYLFEQIPYLISGGLIGLALVTGAGLLYFGSWVARSAAAQQRASEQTLELLREIRDGLGHQAPRTAANGSATGFVATARGSMWHRPACPVAAGRQDLHAVGADGDGLQPCALCNPLSTEPVHA
jgi:hypothetical protein